MALRSETRKARLASWLQGHRPEVIGQAEWAALKDALGPVSDSYLRRLLRELQVPLAPLIEGVDVHSLEGAERTLLALAAESTTSRPCVIQAKDKLRWALRRNPGDTAKTEMLLWVMTWLENPESFGLWLQLRKRRI